jgi:RNA polymerase sigma-70 factor (ECF subfamily)
MHPDFEEVHAQFGGAMARVAASFEANRALREELLQEILFAVWRALPSFRGESSLKTFVLRIAHNRSVNHVLSRRKESYEDLAQEPVDPDPGPEWKLAESQRAAMLLRAVRTLPVAQRELITLALEGLSNEEIASVLGITAGNVAVRLSRAKKLLQAELKGVF